MQQNGQNGARFDENGLFQISKNVVRQIAISLNELFGVEVVPAGLVGEHIGHLLFLHVVEGHVRLVDFGRDEQGITEHELSVNFLHGDIVREFVPHSTHKGVSSQGTRSERSINVVN